MIGIPQQPAAKMQQGVTLVEALVAITILGILVGIGLPSYRDTIERSRLKQAAETLKSDMQFARFEAIKRSQNVSVSRVVGNSGAWCYGLSIASNCDCQTAGNCEIKAVSGSQFSDQINMLGSNTSSNFNFRRGTTNAGGVTFSTNNYQARVTFSDTGRVKICTPSGTQGLPGYPVCP